MWLVRLQRTAPYQSLMESFDRLERRSSTSSMPVASIPSGYLRMHAPCRTSKNHDAVAHGHWISRFHEIEAPLMFKFLNNTSILRYMALENTTRRHAPKQRCLQIQRCWIAQLSKRNHSGLVCVSDPTYSENLIHRANIVVLVTTHKSHLRTISQLFLSLVCEVTNTCYLLEA